MNWYYAEDGQQRGPVTQEELDRLVAAGTVTDTTLVWREGLPAWQPWSALKPVGSPTATPLEPPPVAPSDTPAPPAPGRVRCCECGADFAADDTLRYGERHVCAACKPRLLQRLGENAGLGTADGRPVSREEILARDYRVDIGRSFDRAMKLNADNRGLLMGVMVIAYALLFAAQMIPFLGYLAPIFLSGPLIGGMYLVYLKRVRGQPAEAGGVFGGFGPRYWQLMLVHFIQQVLAMALVLPVVLVFMIPVILAFTRNARGGATSLAMSTGMIASVVILVLIVVPVMLFITTSWVFSLPLVADKGLDFWPAMELSRKVVWKHWWRVFWFLIVATLFAMLGGLLCLVGILFTAPIAIAMICYLYTDLFGDLAPQSR